MAMNLPYNFNIHFSEVADMVTVTHGTVVCGYEGPQSGKLNM